MFTAWLRSGAALRVFVVNRARPTRDLDGLRDTALCAWIMERGKVKHFTYNVGAPRHAEGFGRAVELKMRETGR